ncbi:MAG: urea amidolyase family protein [Burkholderiaceae bacterium]|jgi:KipI family sensor histidine kinase inhibitor|nr:urea amidolyase family protein [Burkholderiaceae bacterium]
MKRFLPAGLNALLVELDGLDGALALHAALEREPIAGITEIVPAARTLLLHFDPRVCDTARLIQAIAGRDLNERVQRGGALIEIPVRYDGEDLPEVARLLNITPAEVIRRHTGSTYSVAFTGFAPGFAYLAGGHPSFDVPRRTSPRARIPAGSVGLAGRFSGIYPQASPGGWQLIGTTPLTLWDMGREPPALLQPGFHVRFIDIATLPAEKCAALQQAAPARQSAFVYPKRTGTGVTAGAALEILAPGLQTLLQDAGRPGQAAQGVSASGALDQGALRAANTLVGNPWDEAVLETVAGGLQLRSVGATAVAVTGADAPLTLNTARGARWRVARHQPLALNDGDTLSIGPPCAGVRCYLAVRGGFAVPPVLGSRATDTLARVGPPPLAAGDLLPVRRLARGGIVQPAALPPDAALPMPQQEVVLDLMLGPRADWFTPEAMALLARQRWRVTPLSNRVGLRLEGAQPLARAIAGELTSEGMPHGALQVPSNGQPVLFLADHPLTGGYPVIGCIAPHHFDRAGQIPVGAWLRFNVIRPFEPIVLS